MMIAMKLFRPGIFLLPFIASILILCTLFVVVAPSEASQNADLHERVAQSYTDLAVERTCWARVNDDTTDYDSVQAAIDEAQPGDLVKVSGYCDDLHTRPIPAGYLNGPDSGVITQVVYITKPITLQGGYTSDFSQPPDYQANPTILDAGSQGRVVMIAGNITSTLEGLYITGGDADGLSGSGWRRKGVGGGIFVISSTVSINNNLIYSNTAAMGGGLFLVDSAASIFKNIIRDNVAEVYDVIYSDGGGLYLLESDALVSENLIETNQAGHNGGGMIALDCTPTIVANRLIGNTASFGGGMFLWSSDAQVDKNVILENHAVKFGGGIFTWTCSPMLTNNVIARNQADKSGGGLYINISNPRMIHNTIAENFNGDGSGLTVRSGTPTLHSHAYLTNTIIVSQTIGISVAVGCTATLETTLFGDGAWANQQDWASEGEVLLKSPSYWGNPFFLSPAGDDYHISPDSMAVDLGAASTVIDDIDGQMRSSSLPDIGADEAEILYKEYIPFISVSHLTALRWDTSPPDSSNAETSQYNLPAACAIERRNSFL